MGAFTGFDVVSGATVGAFPEIKGNRFLRLLLHIKKYVVINNMYSGLVITYFAYATCMLEVISGGVTIEKNSSIVIYRTTYMAPWPRHVFIKSSIAIEMFGVIYCTTTFLCSRQVHKPTVGACNTVVSENKFWKGDVIIVNPSNTPI